MCRVGKNCSGREYSGDVEYRRHNHSICAGSGLKPRMSAVVLLLASSMLLCVHAGAQASSDGGSARALGAWMNPDIGFVYDLKLDLHDAESADGEGRRWTTRGFDLSTAEISVGADVDPYCRIEFNAVFSETGAEIHELYFVYPALPMNLKLKGGRYLANFGRWSQFHSHATPFSSEPRLLHEYLEGHLSPAGLEVSWLVPVSHFIEVTGGVYNAIEGHSHDTDPACSKSAWGRDNPPPGCHFHGDDIHCPGRPDQEAAYNASVRDPRAPVRTSVNKGLRDLAFLGRATTSFEPSLSWSIDMGGSIVHQPRYARSQRFDGEAYGKTTYGADVTVFWNPPEKNLFTGVDFGVEYIANDEQFEIREAGQYFRRGMPRSGFFAYGRYRANKTWSGGLFGESFEARRGEPHRRERFGAFLTCNVSHFQYVRLEYSRYDRLPGEDPVNRFVIQFDGVIGYHTHGRQR